MLILIGCFPCLAMNCKQAIMIAIVLLNHYFCVKNMKIYLHFHPFCDTEMVFWSSQWWIDNILALVQIMAWCLPGDKPLSWPMTVSLLTHISDTWPQWVYIWNADIYVGMYVCIRIHIYLRTYMHCMYVYLYLYTYAGHNLCYHYSVDIVNGARPSADTMLTKLLHIFFIIFLWLYVMIHHSTFLPKILRNLSKLKC